MAAGESGTSQSVWRGISRYQWLVLAIASAGWVFDVFEGQLFVSLKENMLDSLVGRVEGSRGREPAADREYLFNLSLAAFLLGGAVGGVLFGNLADRWGRRRVMAFTIAMYSVFTGLTAAVQTGWQLMLLRFLVGMGVGGEWAVAAAAVAEVFPPRARPAASGIFHASSVLGTFLAVGAGFLVLALGRADSWRFGFLLGLLPALLVAWVRVSMREPENWQAARKRAEQDASRRLGSWADLFATPRLRRHTLLGTALAVIGLATFWGTHIRGQDLLRQAVEREQFGRPVSGQDPREEVKRVSELANNYRLFGMFLATAGGGAGLLAFAPISQRLGRRNAFLLFHFGGFFLVALACALAAFPGPLMIVLPVFGFFTLGMHAGYAVYFPELFPTRLRGTGAGFCFNTARVFAGPVLLGFAYLQGRPLNLGLPLAMLILGGLFLVGAVLVFFIPETRGQPLPE
jgi:MFS family permease